jgi:hypothetical protein
MALKTTQKLMPKETRIILNGNLRHPALLTRQSIFPNFEITVCMAA